MEDIGPEVVVTIPGDPAFEREAWLGLVFRGDLDGLLPAGFNDVGGQCVGDPDSDDFCAHSLSYAQSVEGSNAASERWLILLGRFRSRDEEGHAEWEVVDMLYIEYPSGRGLTLQTECWADSDASVDFGVGEKGCTPKRPLRAWYADWQTEIITEIPITSNLFCSDVCD